jgi:hypothetical protein
LDEKFVDLEVEATTSESLIGEAGGLLDAHAIRSKGARVDVIVSDSVGHVLPLAWQPALSSPQQLQGYARASLVAQGTCAEGQWAVQGAFRQYGQSGLGLALPTATIEHLRSLLADRGARLRSVLPLSAAVYWTRAPGSNKELSLALVCERARMTGLIYRGGSLMQLDAEPVSGMADLSLRRLARRLGACGVLPKRISVWRGAQYSFDQGALQSIWPEASVFQVERRRWSVR